MARPVLFVLAGVNGAGKSSIGGLQMRRVGLDWFNPDTYARELMNATGLDQGTANAQAWQEGVRRLDEAIALGRTFAFETTLGGNTVPAKIQAAAASHEVMVWFCGLESPERHIARVQLRVAHGGHPIPEAKIRERYPAVLKNLIDLMPVLADLQVYDNSADAGPDGLVPEPRLILQVTRRMVLYPHDAATMRATPDWAKPLVAAAMDLDPDS